MFSINFSVVIKSSSRERDPGPNRRFIKDINLSNYLWTKKWTFGEKKCLTCSKRVMPNSPDQTVCNKIQYITLRNSFWIHQNNLCQIRRIILDFLVKSAYGLHVYFVIWITDSYCVCLEQKIYPLQIIQDDLHILRVIDLAFVRHFNWILMMNWLSHILWH